MISKRQDLPPGAQWFQIPDSNNTCLQVNANDDRQIIAWVKCPEGQRTSTPPPNPASTPAAAPVSGSTVSPVAANPTQTPTVENGTTTSAAPVHHGKGGLGGGAIAGIAIGMLLAGVLIASAIFFMLFRRQKKHQAATYHMQNMPNKGYASSPEKGPTVVTRAVAGSLDDLLPQPVADDTITDEVSKIRDNIKNHVRTYYHSAPVSAAQINEKGLQDLAIATGITTTVLAGALSSPDHRPNAIRLVVAWIILSKVTGERNISLLPIDVAGLATSLLGRTGSSTAQATLYSKWKTITGALLQQRFGKNIQDPGRAQAFANVIGELDSILAPFIQGSVDGSQRRKNLDMILTRSANFAFLLFSQPGSFQFDFTSMHDGLISFPALLQTVGEQGQVLRPSRILVDKEIAM